MKGKSTATARKGAAGTDGDCTPSVLSFVHGLLTNAAAPAALETVLGELAVAFRAASAGFAGLLGHTPVLQIQISADGRSLPGLSLSPEKWRQLTAQGTIAAASDEDRSRLFTALAMPATASWLFSIA